MRIQHFSTLILFVGAVFVANSFSQTETVDKKTTSTTNGSSKYQAYEAKLEALDKSIADNRALLLKQEDDILAMYTAMLAKFVEVFRDDIKYDLKAYKKMSPSDMNRYLVAAAKSLNSEVEEFENEQKEFEKQAAEHTKLRRQALLPDTPNHIATMEAIYNQIRLKAARLETLEKKAKELGFL